MPKKRDTPAGGTRSAAGRVFRILARLAWTLAAWLSAPALLAGVVTRLTVKDSFHPLAIFFYATPWPVLTAMAAVCLIHWWQRPRLRWVNLALLLLCVAMTAARCFAFAPLSREPADFRISYWNVARPEWRLERILAQSEKMAADFAIFGEHREGPRTPPQWAAHFSGRNVLPLQRELLLVAPGEMNRIDRGSLNGVGGFQFYRAVVQGREVFLLMVDFTASLRMSREPGFERLFKIVDAYVEQPLIVIGDFNTPGDSVYFDRLRARLSNAFETAGRGYAATWPMPLPVLQLDHIWTSKHLRVLRCEHRTSVYSDHRAVIADIAFP